MSSSGTQKAPRSPPPRDRPRHPSHRTLLASWRLGSDPGVDTLYNYPTRPRCGSMSHSTTCGACARLWQRSRSLCADGRQFLSSRVPYGAFSGLIRMTSASVRCCRVNAARSLVSFPGEPILRRHGWPMEHPPKKRPCLSGSSTTMGISPSECVDALGECSHGTSCNTQPAPVILQRDCLFRVRR